MVIVRPGGRVSLALKFELRIEERGTDRITVSVLLAPEQGPTLLEGVALQLFNRTGEAQGVRMLLPIAGELHQAMLSTVELKIPEGIALGSRVVATAWRGAEQREASVPTDPFTELEVHMRARRRILAMGSSIDLERLIPEERALFARDFPWIDEPRMPQIAGELTVVESEETVDEEEYLDDLVDNLGLDPESSEWLRELLDEEDPDS
jgi:hypothetical protein